MREKWIKLGCILTGFNYHIVGSCSELAQKRIIKYVSALLILCVIWSFTGYQFVRHYFKGEWYMCVAGSLIMMLIVIQIERQILLSAKNERGLHSFRLVMGLTMAIIGSVIMDQVIFQQDIDKQKMLNMDEEVDRVLPGKEEELKRQIAERNAAILLKENERRLILDDLTKHPFIWSVKIEEEDKLDSVGNKIRKIIKQQVPNNKGAWIAPIDAAILTLRKEITTKDSLLLGLRPQVELDLKANVGFLDELRVMVSLLRESTIALVAWIIWFVFLICMELFILVSKRGETETDYDRRMLQQMELHFRRIELLGRQSDTQ